MNKSQSKRKCSRCKRQGHTITTCYAKTDVKGNYIKSSDNYDKVNIGMLGNIVSQLHIHVVLRKIEDVAWPGPVWGRKFNNLDKKKNYIEQN